MLIEVKTADEGDGGHKAAFALEDLEAGSIVWKGGANYQPRLAFNKIFGPWDSDEAGGLLVFIGEKLEDDSCVEVLGPDDEATILALAGIPSLPPVNYKLFSELHRGMKEYENRRTVNSDLSISDGEVLVKTREKILKGSEVQVNLNRKTVLRQLLRNVPPSHVLSRLALLTLLQPFNNLDTLPSDEKSLIYITIMCYCSI